MLVIFCPKPDLLPVFQESLPKQVRVVLKGDNAAILFFGLLMRIQVRPLMAGIGQLATAGASDELNASMAASLKRTKPFVIAMWICILWAALLGVIQPG